MAEHVCAHVTTECEYRREIHLEDFIPVRGRELGGWVSGLDSGAVEENVDSMPAREDLGYEGGDGFGL